MAFKLFENAAKKRRDEWNSHLSPEVLALVKKGKLITYEQFNSRPMNSYERESLFPLLDNDALIALTELFLKNCCSGHVPGIRPCGTYNEALEVLLIPLLLERFKKLQKGVSG